MVIRSQSITARSPARIGKRRPPTSRGVGIKSKPMQIRFKFESKTKRKLREAKARAKVRREARAKRLVQEALSRQERATFRTVKRLQRIAKQALDKLAAKARRDYRRQLSQAKREGRDRDAANRAYLRAIERLLREDAKRKRQLKKPKPGKKPKKKKLGDRQRPGCNHAPIRKRTARGRRAGEKPTYTDKQTSRYQSLWLRAQRARLLPAPRKSGGYYLFTPGACRGKSYRVTPSVPTFANLVKTLSDVQEGDLPRVWSYEDLVFRWAVTYPSSPGDPGSLYVPGPPQDQPLPPSAPPPTPGIELLMYKAYLFLHVAQFTDPSDLDSSGTGLELSLGLVAETGLYYTAAPPLSFPAPPPYIGEWVVPTPPITTYGYYQYGWNYIYQGFVVNRQAAPPDPPFYLNPAAPGRIPPDGNSPGQPGTAGMTWTSTVFPLDEQQDMLLKFAYLVHAPGAGDSYIDVLQNGSPFKRLLLDDYTKGAKQRALPITLLAGATYQFVIRIAPQSNIEAAIVRLGGQYVCNCPDYAKLQPGFASRFLSEMLDRNWEGSNAGIKVIGDCKHIMRLKLLLGEPLDPSDPPDLAALRQWLKDRGRAVTEQRKQRRKQQTTARRGIKADLAAARRKDRNERLAPRRANRNAAKLRKLKRLQSKRLNPGIPALNRRDRKAKTAQFNQRLKAAEVKRQEAIVNRHNNPRGSSVIDHLPWMPSVD